MKKETSLRVQVAGPLVAGLMAVVALGVVALLLVVEARWRGKMRGQAETLARSIAFHAESVNDASSLQRYVGVMGMEIVDGSVTVLAGEPPEVVASDNPAWVGRSLGRLPENFCARSCSRPREGGEVVHEHGADEWWCLIPVKVALAERQPASGAHLESGLVAVCVDGTEERMDLWLAHVAAAAAFVVLVLGFGVWVFRVLRLRVIAPLERIADTVVRRGEGEVGARVRMAAKNEIGVLAKEIDRLFDKSDEEEQRLQTVANCSSVMIWMTGLDRGLEYCNRVWLDFTGHSLKQELEEGWSGVVHPDDEPKFRALYGEAFVARRVFETEFLMRRADGVFRWMLCKGAPRCAASGDFLGFIGACTDITGRKQEEAAVRQGLGQMEQVLNSSRALVYVTDIKTHEVLFANRAAAAHFGEVSGQRCWEWVSEVGGACEFCKNSRLFDANGEPVEGLVWDYKNAKTGRWYSCSEKAVRWSDGRWAKVMFSTDVTAAKDAEARLKASEERWRFALEGNGDGLWDWDAATDKVYFSPALKAMLGYGEEDKWEHISDWECRVHPDDLPACREALEKHSRGETPFYQAEHRLLCKDGAWKWVLDRGMVVERGPGGEPVRMIGTHSDISRAKSVEEAIRKSEKRFRDVADTAGEYIWEVDVQGRFTYLTERVESLTGFSREELIGTTPFERMGAEEGAKLRVLFAQFVAGRTSFRGVEHSSVTRQGRTIWQRVSGLPVFDESGELVGYRGTAQDITELKERERELMRARDAAQTADKAKMEFLSVMSHEIRTPMNAVLGYAELLSLIVQGETEREYLGSIQASGEILLALINDILDYSKVAAGSLEIEDIPFDPGQVVGEVMRFFALSAKAKGLKLVVGGVPQPVPDQVSGDPTRFRQILTNLVSNAVKFTESGGVVVSLGYERQGEGRGMLKAAVKDTGIGISTAGLSKLFGVFAQADSSVTRRYGGTGLGLAISKKLAEQMGGTVGAESVEGVGSTFTAEVAVWECAQPAGGGGAGGVSPEIPDTLGMRVLVADDNAANLGIAVQMVKRLGCEFDAVENGADAVELVSRRAYDVVLMDIQMPVLGGVEAAAKIRELERFGRLPAGRRRPHIVALTAFAMAGDRDRFLRAGMDDYIPKPIKFAELAAMLKRVQAAKAAAAGGRGSQQQSCPDDRKT